MNLPDSKDAKPDRVSLMIQWLSEQRSLINELIKGEVSFSFAGKNVKPNIKIVGPDLKIDD